MSKTKKGNHGGQNNHDKHTQRVVDLQEAKKQSEIQNIPEKNKKLAIVGCSQSKSLAPFDDPDFEIWGVNNLYHHIPRASRWFEIHLLEHNGKQWIRRGNPEFRGQSVDDYLTQLNQFSEKHNCPIYVQRKVPILTNCIEYPIQNMLNAFGGYFTNTISYELALAIAEGFKEIHVYGVDMAVHTEYHHQRPSCEYFLGIALGQGIKIYIPDEADLLKTRFLYGFQEPKVLAWNKKKALMRQAIDEKLQRNAHETQNLQAQMEQKKNQMHQYIGAKSAIDELDKVWS